MSALRNLDWRTVRAWARTALASAVVLGLGLVGGGATPVSAQPSLSARPALSAGPVISIKNFAFQGELTVLAGATVTVRNDDAVMHTLTAADGSFTTKTIQPGKSATFKAPAKAGNYAITCKFHPSMAGTLAVGVKPPNKPVITIRNFAFEGDLTVRPGSKVTVRNADSVMHTLTAVDGSFTTKTIPPGKSATFRAPKTVGSYPITCNFHPDMAGVLTVAKIAVPPPPPPPPPPPAPVVTIRGFAFEGDLTVHTGVTVEVNNADAAPHTLSAVDGTFTTPTIAGGGSSTFTAPATPGSYPITCHIHPSMSGTLTVTADHQHHHH
jgi:plastocyanin